MNFTVLMCYILFLRGSFFISGKVVDLFRWDPWKPCDDWRVFWCGAIDGTVIRWVDRQCYCFSTTLLGSGSKVGRSRDGRNALGL